MLAVRHENLTEENEARMNKISLLYDAGSNIRDYYILRITTIKIKVLM